MKARKINMADDFFKQAGEQIKKGMDWVADKTGDLLGAGENQINLMQAKSRLDNQYKELGQLFYQMSTVDQLQIETLREKCDEISKTITEIEQGKSVSKPKNKE